MPTTLYTPITASQLAGVGGGAAGAVMIGPFVAANTGSAGPGLGGFAGYNYGPINNGSVLGATLSIASGSAGTASIAITKNGSSIVTAFSSVAFTTTGKYFTATFASGTYTFVNGDNLGLIVSASSGAFTMAAFLNLSTS